MKKLFSLLIVTIVVVAAFIASKPGNDKFGDILQRALKVPSINNFTVYVYFKDKGPDAESKLSNPLGLVSQRSLDRRAKVLPAGHLVDMSDVPLFQGYVNQVAGKVNKVRHQLKWFNALTVEVNRSQLYDLSNLDFVSQMEVVETFVRRTDDIEMNKSNNIENTYNPDSPLADSLSYG